MSSVKNITNISDLEKDKEISFQSSEIEYHQRSFLEALHEAEYHHSKIEYHTNNLSELKFNFNMEADHVC
jgi:hypothetical protein